MLSQDTVTPPPSAMSFRPNLKRSRSSSFGQQYTGPARPVGSRGRNVYRRVPRTIRPIALASDKALHTIVQRGTYTMGWNPFLGFNGAGQDITFCTTLMGAQFSQGRLQSSQIFENRMTG